MKIINLIKNFFGICNHEWLRNSNQIIKPNELIIYTCTKCFKTKFEIMDLRIK